MKTLVLYDSAYGNTERVARAIGSAITGEIKVLCISQLNPSRLEPVDFLIIGSPTQNTKPTKAMHDFLNKLPESALKGMRVAAFDTRYSGKLVGIFGFAAGKIADTLESKGAALAVPPEGFYVKGKMGPLKDGELERAATWARQTLKTLSPVKV